MSGLDGWRGRMMVSDGELVNALGRCSVWRSELSAWNVMGIMYSEQDGSTQRSDDDGASGKPSMWYYVMFLLRNIVSLSEEWPSFRDFPKCRTAVHQKQSTAVYILPHKNPNGVTREPYIASANLQRK